MPLRSREVRLIFADDSHYVTCADLTMCGTVATQVIEHRSADRLALRRLEFPSDSPWRHHARRRSLTFDGLLVPYLELRGVSSDRCFSLNLSRAVELEARATLVLRAFDGAVEETCVACKLFPTLVVQCTPYVSTSPPCQLSFNCPHATALARASKFCGDVYL
jgi:hypothetical protein